MSQLSKKSRSLEIYHPVRIMITDPKWIESGLPVKYDGCLKNLSKENASINLEEGYHPVDLDKIQHKEIQVEIDMPSLNQYVSLAGRILWAVKQERPKRQVIINVKLNKIDPIQEKKLEQLFSVPLKDKNMLWDLWDGLRMNE